MSIRFPWAGWEYGGEFKIDQAETPIALPVSHVPNIRVIVTNPVLLELPEELLDALLIDPLNPAPAVGRHDLELFWIEIYQRGHK
jgi:hypothetical protein